MHRFQLRDASDRFVGEGSFGSMGEAVDWAQDQNLKGGWVLHQRVDGKWSPVRRSRVDDVDSVAGVHVR